MIDTDVVVIGGGAAGLAAAEKAAEYCRVFLIDRSDELGGILSQCIHDGFGNFIFKESFTGPEYAERFIDSLNGLNIDIKLGTTVTRLYPDKRIVAVNEDGILEVQTKAVVLATGCRERTRNQILIPGSRPAGIYTAGTVQYLINTQGILPGRKVVILGSGDVGLIVARRLVLEGAEVLGVYEIRPSPSALPRNIVQCLEDFDIPLFLSHTVIDIHGSDRVNGVTVAKVDRDLKSIPGTEKFIPCDTLILAVGLIPENELAKQVGIPLDECIGGPIVDNNMETLVSGFFACGNVVQVHDLVDDVTTMGWIAGKFAALHALNKLASVPRLKIIKGNNISSVVPQRVRVDATDDIPLYIRVRRFLQDVMIIVKMGSKILHEEEREVVRPSVMEKLSFTLPREGSLNDIEIEVRESK